MTYLRHVHTQQRHCLVTEVSGLLWQLGPSPGSELSSQSQPSWHGGLILRLILLGPLPRITAPLWSGEPPRQPYALGGDAQTEIPTQEQKGQSQTEG